jgi:hypothetical protein
MDIIRKDLFNNAVDFLNNTAIDTAILLLPHDSELINNAFIEAVNQSKMKFTVLSPFDVRVMSGTESYKISEEMSEILLKLYSLYRFTDRLIIGSLEYPNGQKLGNLVNNCMITLKEYAQILVERV